MSKVFIWQTGQGKNPVLWDCSPNFPIPQKGHLIKMPIEIGSDDERYYEVLSVIHSWRDNSTRIDVSHEPTDYEEIMRV